MKKERGFTLIEVLVALAVFAILATLTSSALYYAFNTRSRVSEQVDRLNNLQLVISLIQHDISQTIAREVRGDEMRLFPAFVGEAQYLELTRDGIMNPNSVEKRSTLQRIAYLCRGGKLLRLGWDKLDTTNRKRVREKVLLDNLNSCHFAYLNQSSQILSEWRANAVQQNQRSEPLPKAVQVNFTIKDWDKLSMLFIIPEALYAES